MPHITVDEEQARLIAQTPENVEIRDRSGRYLGRITHGFTQEDIAIALRRRASNKPRYTTEQVLERLQALERE